MKYFSLLIFFISLNFIEISLSEKISFYSDVELENDNNDTSIENVTIISENYYRLPNTSKPISYDIHLFTEIHKGEFNFSGTVKIRLKIIEKTDSIVLHARQLDNFEIKLIALNDSFEFSTLNYTLNPKTDLLKIYSEKEALELEPNEEYLLEISYTGFLRDDASGFFKESYKNWQGENIWIAATQFEATDARHAFPCFDEPALKAKFSVSITHGKDYTAISNMPEILSIQINDELKTTTFEESPIMSTYLVAFVVSNFQSVSSVHHDNNFTQRVFSRPGVIDNCNFALNTTLRTLQAIEDYFEIKMSVPKMDHIGLPNASSLAMENWGLIIYKEDALLTNRTTSRSIFEIATVITHEYIHQLFGNLVTPKWWTFTWLSEAFATLYSYKITEMLFPDWNMKDTYFIMRGSYTLSFYALDTHPMTHYVEAAHDIMVEAFHWVSYYKGCGVLRMFESAIGEPTFKKGIKKYLKKYQYSAAEEDDLLECLQEAVDEDNIPVFNANYTFKKAMKSWTNQAGYPLLTVTRHYENGSFLVEQEIFIGDEGQPAKNKSSLWWIPVNFATASEPDFAITTADFLMPPIQNLTVDETITGREIFENDWIVMNKQRSEYYRVNYDERNWNLITSALKNNPNSIHNYNKAQLIKDAFIFFLQDRIDVEIFLDLISYLKEEKNVVVWASIEEIFIELITESQAIPEFGIFLRNLIRPIFLKVGYNNQENDSSFMKFARQIVVRIACGLNVAECSKAAAKELREVRKTGKEIDLQRRRFYYCFGLMRANDEDFDYFLNRMLWSECEEEQRRLISALSCSKNPEHLRKLINSILNLETFAKHSLNEKLQMLENLRNCDAVGAIMQHLNDFYPEYKNLTSIHSNSSKTNPFRSTIMHLSRFVCSKGQESKLKDFVDLIQEHHSFSEKDIKNINENIEENLEVVIGYGENIRKWISNYGIKDEVRMNTATPFEKAEDN